MLSKLIRVFKDGKKKRRKTGSIARATHMTLTERVWGSFNRVGADVGVKNKKPDSVPVWCGLSDLNPNLTRLYIILKNPHSIFYIIFQSFHHKNGLGLLGLMQKINYSP